MVAFSPYIIDAIAVFIVLYLTIKAYKLGFLRSVVLFVGYVFSIVAALYISRIAATYLYDTFVRTHVINSVNEAIKSATNVDSIASALPVILSIFPKFIANAILSAAGGEFGAIEFLKEKTGGILDSVGITVADAAVEPIVFSIMQTVICVIVFIFCIMIVKTIAKIFKGLYAIPILGTLNGLLGGVLGILQSAIFLLLWGLIANAIVAITANSLNWFNDSVLRSTVIFKYFYSYFA